MKKCEKCGKEHDGSYGSGRFCCGKCARSYSSSKVDRNKVKIVQCIDCGVDLKVSLHASAKQCKCDDCRKHKKYITGKIYKHCLNCGRELIKNQKKYCSKECNSEHKYLTYIERWKNGLEKGLHGDNGENVNVKIRKYMFLKYNDSCQECGWSVVNKHTNKIPLTVHHKDGDYKNNKEYNLELLCPNCHSLTDNYGSRNKKSRKNGRNEWRKNKRV